MGAETPIVPLRELLISLLCIAVGCTTYAQECQSFQKYYNTSSTEVDLSSNNFPLLRAKCLIRFTIVKNLRLKNCKIQEIEPESFNTMESLSELDLSNNFLTYLPENLFENNKQLQLISLKSNKFSTLPDIGVPLRKLDLSRCHISGFNFTKPLEVQYLDLSNNRIEALSSQEMEALNQVSTINLNNNRWKCDSQFEQVLCWSLYKINASLERIPIRCTTRIGDYITYTIKDRQDVCITLSTTTITYSEKTFLPNSENPELEVSNTGNPVPEVPLQEIDLHESTDQDNFNQERALTSNVNQKITYQPEILDNADSLPEKSNEVNLNQRTIIAELELESKDDFPQTSRELEESDLLQDGNFESEEFVQMAPKEIVEAELVIDDMEERQSSEENSGILILINSAVEDDDSVEEEEKLYQLKLDSELEDDLMEEELYQLKLDSELEEDLVAEEFNQPELDASLISGRNVIKRKISRTLSENLTIWVIIAFIGWMFFGVAIALLLYTCIFICRRKTYKKLEDQSINNY